MSVNPTPFPLTQGLDTITEEHAFRILGAVERATQFLDEHVGSPHLFEAPDALADAIRLRPDEIDVVLALLHWRGLLSTQHDPISGTVRLLSGSSDVPKRRARHAVADKIAFRVKLGMWAGNNFPTIEAMRDEFRCGLHTLCAALQLLKEQGLAHKVLVVVDKSGRTDYLWRPVDVAGADPDALYRVLRAAILAGELTGILPYKAEMAARHNVSLPIAASAYAKLQQEGLIGKGWLSGETKPRWYVVVSGIPEGLSPGDTRTLSVARAVVDRLPYWLSALPDGTWARRWLPVQEALKRDYGTDVFVIEMAMELLVHVQILERAALPQRRYVPRPPLDGGAAYGLTFRQHKRRKRRWERASAPVAWLPLPTSGDDPVLQSLSDRLSRRARERKALSGNVTASGARPGIPSPTADAGHQQSEGA